MEHVKRGKLKLKTGNSLKVVSSSKDKKKKKRKSKNESRRHPHDGEDDRLQEQEREEDVEILTNDMTPAQRRHEEHRRKRVRSYGRIQRDSRLSIDTALAVSMFVTNDLCGGIWQEQAEIEKMAGKTYRERVEELNQYLGSLTEHHDVPRVRQRFCILSTWAGGGLTLQICLFVLQVSAAGNG